MPFEPGNKLGHRFTSDDQPAVRGKRKPKPKLKDIPPDAREKVYAALFHALTIPDRKTAEAYLKAQADELPEYGYLIQVYAAGMMGKMGVAYTSDILDRLFGKPKQAKDITMRGNLGGVNITVADPDAAAGLQRALDTGGQPAAPKDEDDTDI